MSFQKKDAFGPTWFRIFIIFLAIMEIVAVIMYTFTELGHIGSNFWTTNVFAGSWSGLLMLVHIPILFVDGICLPTPKLALWAVIISVINLLADALLISFKAVFLAQPSTCILGSSCASNANSTSISTYTFQQNFYAVFNSLGPFKTYTQSQAKYLFQTVQLSVGCLMFVLHVIHLTMYIYIRNKASKQVTPIQQRRGYRIRRPIQQREDYDSPQPVQQREDYDDRRPVQQREDYDTRRPVRTPQVKPGEIPWKKNRRY